MPICEADPWRLQYFERAACPPDVNIPTEDSDAWLWYPDHRWVYDKIAIALSQGLDAGPHGVPPPRFPVFSKPITNLKGMGVASRVLSSQAEYEPSLTPGHMWMTLLDGRHVSSDVAVVDGEPRWWRHATGEPGATDTAWCCSGRMVRAIAIRRPRSWRRCGACLASRACRLPFTRTRSPSATPCRPAAFDSPSSTPLTCKPAAPGARCCGRISSPARRDRCNAAAAANPPAAAMLRFAICGCYKDALPSEGA